MELAQFKKVDSHVNSDVAHTIALITIKAGFITHQVKQYNRGLIGSSTLIAHTENAIGDILKTCGWKYTPPK